MSDREITVGLGDLDELTSYLDRYAANLDGVQQRIVSETAQAVRDEAEKRYHSSSVTLTTEVSSGEATVTASGESMPFLEFGSGVKYNGPKGSYNYPADERPGWVKPIGTWGQGKGANETWYYPKDGVLHRTHGIEARQAMYHAGVLGEKQIVEIARRALDD